MNLLRYFIFLLVIGTSYEVLGFPSSSEENVYVIPPTGRLTTIIEEGGHIEAQEYQPIRLFVDYVAVYRVVDETVNYFSSWLGHMCIHGTKLIGKTLDRLSEYPELLTALQVLAFASMI